MIAKFRRKNSRYPDLTPGQNYMVIGIEADDLRILNDKGRPYLYPLRLFEIIDAREPVDWITDLGEEKERYAYPHLLSGAGFFEDFFEDKKGAVTTFWRVVNQHLATKRARPGSVRKKSASQLKSGRRGRVFNSSAT